MKRHPKNREQHDWYRISDKADDGSVVSIDLYDEIDPFWGVGAAQFRDEINGLNEDVTTIDLHVNSPGGDVYEAIAIMNSLRQHRARVDTTVDGLAASSAGFIAVGASDSLTIAENAEIMAHLPWAVTIGDAADMRKMADDLERIGKNIASIFAARAGGSVDEWMTILTAETWWSAQEAVDAGIADKVLKAPTKADAKNSARSRFDLSIFNHAGRSNAPAPRIPQAHNETPPTVEAEKEKEPNMGTLSESALQKLGLTADADESAIDAAIDAALAEKVEGDPAPDAEPTIEQAAAVAAKFGQKLVNSAHYDQITATVAGLQARHDAQIADENEAVIINALKAGRFEPKDAQVWRDEIKRNPEGIKTLIATLAENTALAVTEIGHGVDSEGSNVDADKALVFAKITGHDYGKGV